jgi:hypothetical protein
MLKHLRTYSGLNGSNKFTKVLADLRIERQQEEFMEDVLAVIFIFGTPVLVALIVFSFVLLRYNQRQRTIRLALEKGQDLSPFLAQETGGLLQPQKYVLRGLLWGLPGVLIGVAVTWAAIRHNIPSYFAMFGWIPATVGAAYLIFYRMGLANNRGAADSSLASTSLAPPHRTME